MGRFTSKMTANCWVEFLVEIRSQITYWSPSQSSHSYLRSFSDSLSGLKRQFHPIWPPYWNLQHPENATTVTWPFPIEGPKTWLSSVYLSLQMGIRPLGIVGLWLQTLEVVSGRLKVSSSNVVWSEFDDCWKQVSCWKLVLYWIVVP